MNDTNSRLHYFRHSSVFNKTIKPMSLFPSGQTFPWEHFGFMLPRSCIELTGLHITASLLLEHLHRHLAQVSSPVWVFSSTKSLLWFWNKKSRTVLSSWSRQNSNKLQDIPILSCPVRNRKEVEEESQLASLLTVQKRSAAFVNLRLRI